MKNNKTALLALLIWAGSAMAIAAEPQPDASGPSVDAHAKLPALTDATAKPVTKKKKPRAAKMPASAVRHGHAEAVHEHAAASVPAVVNDNPARLRNRVSGGHSGNDMHAIDATHINTHDAAIELVKNEPAINEPVKKEPELEAVPAVAIQRSEAVIESAKEEACSPPLKSEIAALFDRWNASLKTGDAKKVVANYATPSILLPTVSNQARFTAAEKEDYFMHFLQRKPVGTIEDRMIEVDCNSATDAGLYSFRFGDGSVVKARYSFAYKKVGDEWLISSHHSSSMPEKTTVADPHEKHTAQGASSERQDAPAKNGGWIRFP